MNMKLNTVYENVPMELVPSLRRVYKTFNVPTEVVVINPDEQKITPILGRVYNANYYEKKGRVFSTKTIVDYLRKKGKAIYNEGYRDTVLVELYENRGDDGHIWYYISGYAFLTKVDFDRLYKEHLQYMKDNDYCGWSWSLSSNIRSFCGFIY